MPGKADGPSVVFQATKTRRTMTTTMTTITMQKMMTGVASHPPPVAVVQHAPPPLTTESNMPITASRVASAKRCANVADQPSLMTMTTTKRAVQLRWNGLDLRHR